jgi:hypothetical protein
MRIRRRVVTVTPRFPSPLWLRIVPLLCTVLPTRTKLESLAPIAREKRRLNGERLPNGLDVRRGWRASVVTPGAHFDVTLYPDQSDRRRSAGRAVTNAVEGLRRRRGGTSEARVVLVRERDRTAAGIRHLVEAVKLGHATDTLLSELAAQESALKALERRISELDRRRAVAIDETVLAGRVTAAAAGFRDIPKANGLNARRSCSASRTVAACRVKRSARPGT